MNSYRSGFGQMVPDESAKFLRQYKSTMSRISAWDVLAKYAAEETVELDTGRGLQIQHRCLIDRVDPHHARGDQRPSATIHVEKKLYNCYSYGGGDLFWLLQKMENTDTKGILPILSELMGDTIVTGDKFLEEIEKYFVEDGRVPVIPSYSDRILKPWLLIHPYMTEVRGVSREVLEAHSVGYDEEQVRIVLPHFWKGKLVGWQKRSLNHPEFPQTPKFVDDEGIERTPPKYQNSKSFPKQETLYLSTAVASGARDEVLVVEGVLSVLVAETIAGQVPGRVDLSKCVSTFGAKVSDDQIKFLREFKKVTLWMDNDLAGVRATLRLMDGLEKFCRLEVIDESDSDDIAGISVDEVRQKLKTAEPSVLARTRVEKKLTRLREEMTIAKQNTFGGGRTVKD